MNTRTPMRKPRLNQRRLAGCLVSLLLIVSAGCVPASTQLPGPPAPTETEPPPRPATLSPTATREALTPAGWVTHTSQRCEYAIGYPADMQVSSEGTYSRIFRFTLANPDEGARNFVYMSVIAPEIQNMAKQGLYNHDVYNYDPAEAEILLNMQAGESKPVRELPNVESGFTYQRQPDTTIGGHAAQTYENIQPWEFPGGTKEIRYYLSLNGCTYQIGGYLDTTQSNQPGAITEDLFHQMMATIQVMP